MLRLDDGSSSRRQEELPRAQTKQEKDRGRKRRESERESAPSMNNASLGSAEHRGCARTSEPQLELEESSVHSIERDAVACAPGWTLAQRGCFDLL